MDLKIGRLTDYSISHSKAVLLFAFNIFIRQCWTTVLYTVYRRKENSNLTVFDIKNMHKIRKDVPMYVSTSLSAS